MISCIIVLYHPDNILLKQCIQSIIPQIDLLIIVNNDSIKFTLFDDIINKEKIHIIDLGNNYGIAYAQNRGIEFALSHNSDFILFSDQDTNYPNDFVEKGFECYKQNSDQKIAAIVPLFYNENKKQYSQVNISKIKTVEAEIGKQYEVSHAISSGTISLASVFADIGFMNERLFIDFVDYEWCWRAVNKDFKIICDTNIVIHHNMGDSFKKVLGRKIVVYSDFRNYFFFRNGTWLLYHSHLFSFTEWIGFFNFMFLKSILFFLTKGISFKNIKLLFKAFFVGCRNSFSLESSVHFKK